MASKYKVVNMLIGVARIEGVPGKNSSTQGVPGPKKFVNHWSTLWDVQCHSLVCIVSSASLVCVVTSARHSSRKTKDSICLWSLVWHSYTVTPEASYNGRLHVLSAYTAKIFFFFFYWDMKLS